MTIATQATLAALLAKVTADPATGTGQTGTGTKLDTLHSDLTGLTPAAKSVNVAATLSALNAAADGTTDLAGYASVKVQITGTYSGTLGFQVSNDGTNWNPRMLAAVNGGTAGTGPAAGSVGSYYGDIGGRYFRVLMSAYTSGSAAVTVAYNAAPAANVPTLANGNQIIGGVYIGTGLAASAITATSAATTNATSASGSPRSLQEVTVSNPSASAVYLKFFNKASAPTVGTDVPILTIPVAATATVGMQFGANGKRFTVGLAWALTGAFAATDTTAVAAGVQVSGTYV